MMTRTKIQTPRFVGSLIGVTRFNQSSVCIVEDHKTGLTNREFEALKERVSEKSLVFRRVCYLNATLPLSTAGVSVSPTGNLCSVCKFWQNGEEQVVIGTLDINQCLKMVDKLTGKRLESIESDITRAYLSNVCIAKELQRNGFAYGLITKAIAVARSWGMADLYVHVAVDNGGARKLYDKCGFVYENEEKTYVERSNSLSDKLARFLISQSETNQHGCMGTGQAYE